MLCTYNRCSLLSRALASVATQILPQSISWEVVVVDNNSNDETRSAIEAFCIQYPSRFRYHFEPQPGLSNARNSGIRVAKGSIVVFTDDDVVVPPDWLQNLTASLRARCASGAGGRILPDKGFSPPEWLSVECGYSLAPLTILDRGLQPGQMDEAPFGANMAFRREMFEKYGYFRTDLGRCAKGMMSNEDTEFGQRLLRGGELIHYEPSAIVYHPVPADRLCKDYFLTWAYNKGRSDMRQHGPRPNAVSLVRVPLYLFRDLAVCTIKWLLAIARPTRFARKLDLYGKLGEIVEATKQKRQVQIGNRGGLRSCG